MSPQNLSLVSLNCFLVFMCFFFFFCFLCHSIFPSNETETEAAIALRCQEKATTLCFCPFSEVEKGEKKKKKKQEADSTTFAVLSFSLPPCIFFFFSLAM